jgi:hypothetical protein
MHGVLSISIFSNEAEMHNSFPVFAFSLTLKSFTNVLLRAISFTVLLSASVISSSSTPVFQLLLP